MMWLLLAASLAAVLFMELRAYRAIYRLFKRTNRRFSR
jgi:hypothetical protein